MNFAFRLGFKSILFVLVTQSLVWAQQGPAPKVTIAAAYSDELTEQVTFIGKGEAKDKIDIIARVSGFVEEILVKDGQEVSQGDILFRVEADTYEATLAARQADFAQARANLHLTEVELERKQELFDRDVGSEADRDVAFANNQVAIAGVQIAQAAIQRAQLDVDYTDVHAPFDGRAGKASVSVGELVGPTTKPLINLVRVAPIFVEFALTERQLINVMEEYQSNVDDAANEPKSRNVYVVLPNGDQLDEVGKVVFADNRIDPATGTIIVRAEFPNASGLIIDGSYLTVRIEDTEPTKVLMIPQASVQRDQRGDFVLVVGQQGTVEQRYVTLGRQVKTAVVVQDGMREGEAVIVEGLQKVRPGVAVDAVLSGTAKKE